MSTCQAAGATAAQERSSLDAAADDLRLLFSRVRDLKSAGERVREALERMKLLALNAGLEGARMGEAMGRPLVNVAEEMKTLVMRGLDAIEEQMSAVEQADRERERMREHVEQARQAAAQLADELLRAQAMQRQATTALGELAEHLQRTTGTDPETARVLAEAVDHAQSLAAVLGRLSSPEQRRMLLKALMPVLAPVLGPLRDSRAAARESVAP
jgi:methyl-accepting chemotaxis protein